MRKRSIQSEEVPCNMHKYPSSNCKEHWHFICLDNENIYLVSLCEQVLIKAITMKQK